MSFGALFSVSLLYKCSDYLSYDTHARRVYHVVITHLLY